MARHWTSLGRRSAAGLLGLAWLLGSGGCAGDDFMPLPPSGILGEAPMAFESEPTGPAAFPAESETASAEAKASRKAAARAARLEAAARKKAAAAEKDRLRREEAETARIQKEADRAAAKAVRETRKNARGAEPAARTSAETGAAEGAETGAPRLAGRGGDYVLQVGDELDVQVYREPELSGTFKLNAAGEIRHSLIGAVPLAGQTVDEAEAEFTRRLAKDYLVNPRVIVKLVSTQSSQIVLMGEVAKPGVYPLPFGGQMTLLQAIAGAGGFTELASPDRVSLVRRLPGGGQTTLKIRVSDLLGGKGKQPDVPLEPNDVIMVPQVFF